MCPDSRFKTAPKIPVAAAEADLVELVAALEEPVLVTRSDLQDPGPTIVAVSVGLCTMTRYRPEELLGKNPRIFQGPLTDREVLTRLRTACERGDSFVGEAVNYRKDGTSYLLEWAIDPIHDANGHVTHFISLQRDVSTARPYAREWLEAETSARELLARANAQMAAIAEAILVLEKTKRSFRSKELGNLRDRLVKLAHHSRPSGDTITPRPDRSDS
jgi:PAS domain S-box-containing protein